MHHSRYAVPVLLAALAACSGPPTAPTTRIWEHQEGENFIQPKTREARPIEAILVEARRLHDEKRFNEAVLMLTGIADAPIDTRFREDALYLRAKCLAQAGDPYNAFHEFDRYSRTFPESERIVEIREWMMASALNLARVGYPETFLGILTVRRDKIGIDSLRATLQRFPREDFSDDYYFKLALFFIEKENWDDAELELKTTVLENYRDTNSAPRALLMLGKIGIKRFDSIDYDVKPLADAKRSFERFLGDYPRFKDDPRTLAALGLDGGKLLEMEAEARDGLRFITEKLADKELQVARFYLRKGRTTSALLYLQTIIRDYPQSGAAITAKTLLDSTTE